MASSIPKNVDKTYVKLDQVELEGSSEFLPSLDTSRHRPKTVPRILRPGAIAPMKALRPQAPVRARGGAHGEGHEHQDLKARKMKM